MWSRRRSRSTSTCADWPKLIGVEMEGGGVAAGLHDDIERPRFLMIRGVSDLANAKNNAAMKKAWRAYACHVAAAYAIGLLRDGPVQAALQRTPKTLGKPPLKRARRLRLLHGSPRRGSSTRSPACRGLRAASWRARRAWASIAAVPCDRTRRTLIVITTGWILFEAGASPPGEADQAGARPPTMLDEHRDATFQAMPGWSLARATMGPRVCTSSPRTRAGRIPRSAATDCDGVAGGRYAVHRWAGIVGVHCRGKPCGPFRIRYDTRADFATLRQQGWGTDGRREEWSSGRREGGASARRRDELSEATRRRGPRRWIARTIQQGEYRTRRRSENGTYTCPAPGDWPQADGRRRFEGSVDGASPRCGRREPRGIRAGSLSGLPEMRRPPPRARLQAHRGDRVPPAGRGASTLERALAEAGAAPGK